MAKISNRTKGKQRQQWSNLSGDKPMTGADMIFFWIMLGVVGVLFLAIWASQPPFQIS